MTLDSDSLVTEANRRIDGNVPGPGWNSPPESRRNVSCGKSKGRIIGIICNVEISFSTPFATTVEINDVRVGTRERSARKSLISPLAFREQLMRRMRNMCNCVRGVQALQANAHARRVFTASGSSYSLKGLLDLGIAATQSIIRSQISVGSRGLGRGSA